MRGSASTHEKGAEQGKGKGGGTQATAQVEPGKGGAAGARQGAPRPHRGRDQTGAAAGCAGRSGGGRRGHDGGEFEAAQEEAERQQMEEEYALEREIEGEPTPERPRALARRPPRLLCCLLLPL